MSGFINDFAAHINESADSPAKRRAALIKAGRRDFRTFCNLIRPDFYQPDRAYQDVICRALQDFYEDRLSNNDDTGVADILILNLPPGFGKSYTNALFAAWIYGRNVYNKVITVSYNQELSVQFSKAVRDLITAEEDEHEPDLFCVRSFFPHVRIKAGDAAAERWSLEGRHVYNSYKSTSIDGGITGTRGNLLVVDDPVKDAAEALNEREKDKIWLWYKDTFVSRGESNAKQVIIQTRWATDDLTGRVLAQAPERCRTICMKALDERGRSLCEGVYTTDDLQKKKRITDDFLWLANYEQTPIDVTGALYAAGFKTYDAVDPDRFERVIAYVDTADEGADSLCAVMAGVADGYAYVLDIYYTDEPMETTEPELARRLGLSTVRECVIESNNGGRGFARNVTDKLKASGNRRCTVTWFHQSKNKRTRILVNAASVLDRVVMPEGWEKRWTSFYKALSGYQRKGKNAHDDAPDALTGLYELVIGEVQGRRTVRFRDRAKLLGF